MTTTKQFFLEECITTIPRIGDALRCILHTIVFCRELGAIEPAESNVPMLDICYSKCSDAAIDRTVEDYVLSVVQNLSKKSGGSASTSTSTSTATAATTTMIKKCQIVLTFFKPISKQGMFWTTTTKEPFEDWVITLKLANETTTSSMSSNNNNNNNNENQKDREILSNSLKKTISNILTTISENKAHLPPIQQIPTSENSIVTTNSNSNSNSMPYPFEVSFTENEDHGTVFGTLLGMIRSPHIL